MSLFANDMIAYLRRPKGFVKELLKLIMDFSKVVEYEISIQKSIAFLYTSNELEKSEFFKNITYNSSKISDS